MIDRRDFLKGCGGCAAWITLGGVCSYPGARSATSRLLPPDDPLLTHMVPGHGRRVRYDLGTRADMYRFIIGRVREVSQDVEIGLCLESKEVWAAAGLDPARATCNCVAGAVDLTRRR